MELSLKLNPVLAPQGRLSFEVEFAVNQQHFHNNFARKLGFQPKLVLKKSWKSFLLFD